MLSCLCFFLNSDSQCQPFVLLQKTLLVFASLPGENQTQCINYIMQSADRLDARGNVGSGLLVVAKELSLSHSAQQYSADYSNHRAMLERYIDAIKEMQKVRPVAKWMAENRSQWEWLDQFLQSQANRNDYRRGEYQSRRDRDGMNTSDGNLYDHNNSDSDANGEMNYSDESDDYGGKEHRSGTVVVKGAGMSEINGNYTSTRIFDGVPKYTKSGLYENQHREFTLFRCPLSDGSRRWYISIIPPNQKPGTNKDIDFYFCPSAGVQHELPHEGNWEPISKDASLVPAPTVTVELKDDDLEDSQRVSSNDEYDNVVDDNNYDDEI